jgi:hypothetical protein
VRHKAAIAKTTWIYEGLSRKTDEIERNSAWPLDPAVAWRLLQAQSMRSLAGIAVALVALGGCNLYFGNGDDVQCRWGADDVATIELRDPSTGVCQPFGGGGCIDSCSPCADITAIPAQDWGSCFSQCESLDESSCMATAGCRVAYTNSALDDGPPSFRGCWSVAPSGPVHGSCTNLDAQECSRHDDCSAYYNEQIDDGIGAMFARCAAEAQSCTSDTQCGPGAHCSTSDGECLPPSCDGEDCPVCTGRCVMDGDSCSNVTCGPGSHCEEQCHADSGCLPLCVPDNGCSGVTCPMGSECVQTCDGTDPNNPGCGTCTVQCVPSGTCAGLATEAACKARSDCGPVYQGMDCTCYPNGDCDCQILTYERCESLTP